MAVIGLGSSRIDPSLLSPAVAASFVGTVAPAGGACPVPPPCPSHTCPAPPPCPPCPPNNNAAVQQLQAEVNKLRQQLVQAEEHRKASLAAVEAQRQATIKAKDDAFNRMKANLEERDRRLVAERDAAAAKIRELQAEIQRLKQGR